VFKSIQFLIKFVTKIILFLMVWKLCHFIAKEAVVLITLPWTFDQNVSKNKFPVFLMDLLIIVLLMLLFARGGSKG